MTNNTICMLIHLARPRRTIHIVYHYLLGKNVRSERINSQSENLLEVGHFLLLSARRKYISPRQGTYRHSSLSQEMTPAVKSDLYIRVSTANKAS